MRARWCLRAVLTVLTARLLWGLSLQGPQFPELPPRRVRLPTTQLQDVQLLAAQVAGTHVPATQLPTTHLHVAQRWVAQR